MSVHQPVTDALGSRIVLLRTRAGLTQAQLSRLARISQGYLSQLESGDVSNPSGAAMERMAHALGVDYYGLMGTEFTPPTDGINPRLLYLLRTLPEAKQTALLRFLEAVL